MRYRSLLVAAALSAALLLGSTASWARLNIGVSIRIAPPVLPVYVQPPLPEAGYLWAPGYWAWADDGGYYWVPGTWVEPPQAGLLWTPGYWGWLNGNYAWHEGYWGTRVGFYGGVNYGFGYGGVGYRGGHWENGAFFYNSAANRFPPGMHVTNVYHTTIVNNGTASHVSFNGGAGGIQARPSADELAAQHEPHTPPLAAQRQHEQAASREPALRASVNHGRPAIAATARPGQFSGQRIVAARGVANTHGTAHPNAHTNAHPGAHPNAHQAAHSPEGAGAEAGAQARATPPREASASRSVANAHSEPQHKPHPAAAGHGPKPPHQPPQ